MCFYYGQPGYMQKHCPFASMATRPNNILVATSSALAPKDVTSGIGTVQNCLYTLATHQEFEASPDVVTSTLQLSLMMYIIYLIWGPLFLM